MSFLSDLFEGNFGNLGTDIVDAPSSLINHPADLAETLGAGALIAAPFFAPELFGLGAAGDVAAGAADVGAGAAAGGDLAASLEIGDIGAAADAATGDALAFLPDIGGGLLGFAPDAVGNLADIGTTSLDTLAPFADTTATQDALSSALALQAPDAVPTAPTFAASNFPIEGPGIGGDVTASPEIAQYADNPSFGVPSLTDKIGGVLSSPWTRLALGAAPLALAMFRGEPALPQAALQAQGNAAALSTFGQQQLAMGQAGQLNAGQMALISKTRQDLTNAARQALYNQGVQNPDADTRWPQMLAQIDTQVTAMTAQMIQQEIQNGLSALGSASGTLNQIAQLQMQADQNFTNTLVNATKALGLAVGGGLVTRTTTTTQAAA